MLRINLKRKNMMTWNNETRDIKDGKKESLFSELHSLLSSGLDFGRSFCLLIEGENDKRLKRVLESIYASVVKGQTLWESFAAGKRFSALDYGVLRIGEETGRVDESLRFLADYYHRDIRRYHSGGILLVERKIGFYSLFSVSSGFEDSSCGRDDTEKLSGTFL